MFYHKLNYQGGAGSLPPLTEDSTKSVNGNPGYRALKLLKVSDRKADLNDDIRLSPGL